MSVCAGRVLVAAACLALLSGCGTSNKLGDMLAPGTTESGSSDAAADGFPTGALANTANTDQPSGAGGLLGSDPNDELSLGRKFYRSGNYGIAEGHFRKAVESHPRDAEAWVGLAAAYDKLRRFDLADRAYVQAIGLVGETAELLNNRGYSYMLRGDYARARKAFLEAQARDPANPYVRNNLDLLEKAYRRGKAVQ